MRYLIYFGIVVFVFTSCSKSNEVATKKSSSALIQGTWHLYWEWAARPGNDTVYSDFHAYADKRYISDFKTNGKVYPEQPDSSEDTAFYYRIIGDSLYFSDAVIPDNAVTNPLGHDPYLQGWHIDKLTADTLALSIYGLDYVDSYSYEIMVK